jgi:ketosteroid isomerase-like protein
MSYVLPRALAEDFRKVYAARDVDKIAPYLHDNVEWTISGPVEYLPFCGTYCGKAAVIDLIRRRMPEVLRTFSFEPEFVAVDGDRLAMLHRQSSRRAADGRVINYRVANFMTFRDGKLIKNLSLLDTFDAVEQVLGQRIQFDTGDADVRNGDIVAV